MLTERFPLASTPTAYSLSAVLPFEAAVRAEAVSDLRLALIVPDSDTGPPANPTPVATLVTLPLPAPILALALAFSVSVRP